MTTAAMALAVVPLIIAEGAGAAARQAMGLVIFSGLLIGTMFTLFVVPMFYTLISRSDAAYKADHDRHSKMFAAKNDGHAEPDSSKIAS
jgi:multidrug efflux pump